MLENNVGSLIDVGIDLAKLLLKYGVGLHSHNSTSPNIAHKWARSFDKEAFEVIAIANGIDIDKPNDKGLTPIMIAAIGVNGLPNNIKVLEYLLNQNVQPINRLNRMYWNSPVRI